MLLYKTFTDLSQSHNTTSLLDHCITIEAGKSIVSNMYIVHNIIYFPLYIIFWGVNVFLWHILLILRRFYNNKNNNKIFIRTY